MSTADLFLLLANWGSATPCPGDLDSSGDITIADLLFFLGAWGVCE